MSKHDHLPFVEYAFLPLLGTGTRVYIRIENQGIHIVPGVVRHNKGNGVISVCTTTFGDVRIVSNDIIDFFIHENDVYVSARKIMRIVSRVLVSEEFCTPLEISKMFGLSAKISQTVLKAFSDCKFLRNNKNKYFLPPDLSKYAVIPPKNKKAG